MKRSGPTLTTLIWAGWPCSSAVAAAQEEHLLLLWNATAAGLLLQSCRQYGRLCVPINMCKNFQKLDVFHHLTVSVRPACGG